MRKTLIALLLNVFFLPLSGQDIHYSQFDYSPLNLNPANTGLFDGDYRFAGNQRTQWRSVTVPYSTFSLSADAFEPMAKKNCGIGLLVNHDIAGDSRFKTFQFNLTGTYFLPVKDSTLQITAGALMGITNRSLTDEFLYFDNQYDGYMYNPSLPTNEIFARESRTYMNLQIGFAFFKKFKRRNFLQGGIAFSNLSKPRQSYFDVNSIKLDRRFLLHTTFQYAITEEIEIIPAIQAQFQGTYMELIIGGQGRYILVNEKGIYRAVRAGLFYRTKDAGYLSVGLDYDKWQAGISYDINLSDLVPASAHKGGLELSLIYILDVFRPKMIQRRICPNYI